MFNTVTTSKQMSFQIPLSWEQYVTRGASEGFGQCVDVDDVATMIVVT